MHVLSVAARAGGLRGTEERAGTYLSFSTSLLGLQRAPRRPVADRGRLQCGEQGERQEEGQGKLQGVLNGHFSL